VGKKEQSYIRSIQFNEREKGRKESRECPISFEKIKKLAEGE